MSAVKINKKQQGQMLLALPLFATYPYCYREVHTTQACVHIVSTGLTYVYFKYSAMQILVTLIDEL
jgi:hypothetical protein